MNITEKRIVLDYLNKHNDGKDEARRVIEMMTKECNYADSSLGTVCVDDLLILDEETEEMLREKLGKKAGEKWTVDDCQVVADEICNNEEEGGCFSDWLEYAIEYMDEV